MLAGVVHKVPVGHALAPAIMAQHRLRAARILRRQARGLRREQGVYHLEVDAHVSDGLAADGAGVVVAGVLREAAAVEEVAAGELLDGGVGVEEVLVADGAVALGYCSFWGGGEGVGVRDGKSGESKRYPWQTGQLPCCCQGAGWGQGVCVSCMGAS